MSLATISSYLLTGVVFLAMISVLVAAHEYGHYLLARFFNMGVEEFSIGMGKKLRVWRRKTYDLPVSRSYMHDLNAASHRVATASGAHVAEPGRALGQSSTIRDGTEFMSREQIRELTRIPRSDQLAGEGRQTVTGTSENLARSSIQLDRTFAEPSSFGAAPESTDGLARSDTRSSCENPALTVADRGAYPIAEVVEARSGPTLREETEFTLRLLPIGGFVRIKGMVPQDDGSEVHIPGGFYSKPPWQRLVVLLAGPAASVVSGLLVLICALMIQGVEKPINRPIIEGVQPDTLASAAGLKDNDRIVAIDDRPVATFYDLVKAINSHGGQKLKLTYARGVQSGSVYVTPNITDGPAYDSNLEVGPQITRHGVIGIGPTFHHVSLGLVGAARESIRIPVEAVESIFQMVTQPAAVKEEAGGVITMVATTHAATQAGPGSVVVLACLLSISVGIFNLLPFPPLDGGQMLMAFAELLRGGRRLSIQVQQALVNAGMLLVILLFLVVGFVDVQRYAGPSRSPASVPTQSRAPAQHPDK